MRTQDEIVRKLESVKDSDPLGFKTSDLIGYLDFENAKPHLKPETTEEQWNESRLPSDRESILRQMADYMPFAWSKANGQRGISAARSMAHFAIWTWMAGDGELFGDKLEEYNFYGKPHLKALSAHYGWDFDNLDDGEYSN